MVRLMPFMMIAWNSLNLKGHFSPFDLDNLEMKVCKLAARERIRRRPAFEPQDASPRT